MLSTELTGSVYLAEAAMGMVGMSLADVHFPRVPRAV